MVRRLKQDERGPSVRRQQPFVPHSLPLDPWEEGSGKFLQDPTLFLSTSHPTDPGRRDRGPGRKKSSLKTVPDPDPSPGPTSKEDATPTEKTEGPTRTPQTHPFLPRPSDPTDTQPTYDGPFGLSLHPSLPPSSVPRTKVPPSNRRVDTGEESGSCEDEYSSTGPSVHRPYERDTPEPPPPTLP